MKSKRKKSYVGYAGFVDGKLSIYYDQDYYEGVTRIEIFKHKHQAQKCYQDVRRVTISELEGR